MNRTVREPIQTYLTEEERAELDRAAESLGVSRSEALRRGIRALAAKGGADEVREPTLADVITPAKAPPGAPPPSIPVAPRAEILRELEEDRGER